MTITYPPNPHPHFCLSSNELKVLSSVSALGEEVQLMGLKINIVKLYAEEVEETGRSWGSWVNGTHPANSCELELI